VSFDRLEACKNCGAPLAATAAPPRPVPSRKPEADPGAPTPQASSADGLLELRLDPERPASGDSGQARQRGRPRPGGRDECDEASVEMLDDDAMELGKGDFGFVPPAGSGLADQEGGGEPFRFDDNFFRGEHSEAEAVPSPPGPVFFLPDEDIPVGDGEPIIDRDDEVPERFWAPEVAGLGRRSAALLLDQAVLTAILGVFFLGAYCALRISGFDTDLFLSAAGLRASAPPFALLAALLSLVYHAYFHASTGRTPGKALAGIEVCTGEGAVPSGARAILRWFCAALALACAGVGVAWAMFDPRRLGWADLLSGTMIARQRHEPPGPAQPR
jgi:uncharacterized RDD family membrane protein YckC